MAKIFHHTPPLEKYAWPGGYPLFYIAQYKHETCALCPHCATVAKHEAGTPESWTFRQLLDLQAQANWEDPTLFCDGCGERIESAYAEKD